MVVVRCRRRGRLAEPLPPPGRGIVVVVVVATVVVGSERGRRGRETQTLALLTSCWWSLYIEAGETPTFHSPDLFGTSKQLIGLGFS